MWAWKNAFLSGLWLQPRPFPSFFPHTVPHTVPLILGPPHTNSSRHIAPSGKRHPSQLVVAHQNHTGWSPEASQNQAANPIPQSCIAYTGITPTVCTMGFGHIISSQSRENLSVQQSLRLANFFLDGAGKEQDRDITLALCRETEITLFQAKKSAKHSDDQTVRQGIAFAYIGLGKVLDAHEHQTLAQAIYKKAEKMGFKIQDQGQPTQSSDPSKPAVLTSGAASLPSAVQKYGNLGHGIVAFPSHIFSENARPPAVVAKLPEPDERLVSTPQLACCLALLKDSQSLDSILEPVARNWLQVVENDDDEQERLKILAIDVIRTFKKEEIKDAKAVSEVVCLAPALEKDAFRDLLMAFYNGFNHSDLLDFHQLEGLAQLIQGADSGYLHADDLVKILGLLTTRLQNTHKQSPQHMFQLILAASYVLDAMADTHVTGLDRETLHQPLLSYLDSLKGSTDPFMMYQVAYAYQALLCVPDNETLWQATLRRTTKVIRGVSGLVSAVKGLDLNGLLDGLKDIQQGLAGASEMVKTVVTVFDGVSNLTAGGRGFLKGLKEGLSFQRKCAWYPALRGADAFIREGDFVEFRRLVTDAPCRLDLAFLWGVCQRLGEIAINQTWDVRTRRSAVTFLGEIYRNTEDWGDQASIREWILIILTQVSSCTGSTSQCTFGSSVAIRWDALSVMLPSL
ncbi:hypothetical protein B0O80DRAFT_485072 [Mortierella sp. GBAus27b]|nr:hypothetical protein B0O80DRAFT_485072 [Mortierella sp. GBAus27b]